jgi:alanine racemase
VTVKVDTGLSRNGASDVEFAAMLPVLARARADDAIRLRGIMSHLACGDDPQSPVNDMQATRFSEFRARAHDAGVAFEISHLCNSPGAMTRPDLAYDMVRPGIAVYGQTPIAARGDMGLVPAMTLKCPVALVRSIKAGDGVSYGHTWIADRDTTVALLPIGYADGVFRSLGGRIDVLINGRGRRSVGRICMDQFVVDLGAPDEPSVGAGDEVVLFGPGTSGEPTADDWARACGTIHYEIVTRMGGRLTRRYAGVARRPPHAKPCRSPAGSRPARPPQRLRVRRSASPAAVRSSVAAMPVTTRRSALSTRPRSRSSPTTASISTSRWTSTPHPDDAARLPS